MDNWPSSYNEWMRWIQSNEFLVTILILVAIAYVLPPLIAAARRHHQLPLIAGVSLVLGWTFIGWIAALLWAFTPVDKAPIPQAFKTCPRCAEEVRAAAMICRFCDYSFEDEATQEDNLIR